MHQILLEVIMVNVPLNGHTFKTHCVVFLLKISKPAAPLSFLLPKERLPISHIKTSYVIVRIKDRIGILFLRTSNYLFIMYVIFCINVI